VGIIMPQIYISCGKKPGKSWEMIGENQKIYRRQILIANFTLILPSERIKRLNDKIFK
jgi:hypothetical protein